MLLGVLSCFLAIVAASPTSNGWSRDERSDTAAPELAISKAALTSKWKEGSDLEQIVELVVTNTGNTSYLTSKDAFKVTVESDDLETVTPGSLIRLAPGQSAIVQVGVTNKDGVTPGTNCDATVVATWDEENNAAKQDFSGPCGVGDFEASESSLSSHLSPDWFQQVKFGIFIHWGLYSVPAYGDGPGPNQDYAEWYGFRMTQPDFPTQTYQYHAKTYGEDFNYDDFINDFTDTAFDPHDWMNLIADAGAQYVVPVTKHHDGWALFNHSESISKRSTVHYGPKRDFIKAILDTAKSEHPDIRRGTYFSMPEWFNPAYVKYGWDQHWKGNYFGRPPTNPYTNKSIPYTGFVEVGDYLTDIQSAQMEALIYDYETEIMWCDIGGPNRAPEVLSAWANWARDHGRQITWNNRCGISGDYDTPEYSSGNFQTRKFESNRGMDPFSFGYNFATPDDDYLSGEDIVLDLVSIVANNGNYLLNIGPKKDGTIIDAMRKNLLDAGSWIKDHADGLFGTSYWSVVQNSGSFRYMTKPDSFFIHHAGQPGRQITVSDPVPWLEGDVVTVVGGTQNGTKVDAQKNENGDLVLNLTDDIVNGDQYVWTFKINYATA
ncbi:alpha-L-fucosidase precursor [Fusarium beomiforme]|uniref:alpha-L-fucosidase n=1 Tax=Fusarium beomiforme TaxID=44412 RepID=A0A9P5A6P7_9HYPO|nr:alpha-L-fucosidase precursor [Fusarium beomiforme]